MASNHITPGEQPLLQTKVTIPQIPAAFVSRPRLITRINEGVRRPLTLVAVPVGFGKTHLLIEWAGQTQVNTAWLNVDTEDNDAVRFFQYLIGAFQKVIPGMAEDALYFIQSSKAGSLQMGLTVLINEIAALPDQIVLVLDDFQNLNDDTVFESIDFILKHIPQNLHLIIASRTLPPLDLTAARAKGLVTELDLDDLRFTAPEVEQFCQQVMGLTLQPDIIQVLTDRTAGWVTALQMAAVSMHNQEDPGALFTSLEGDAHYLVDYLAEEVLDQQPDEIRQFLLRSSVLDSMNSSLIESVVKPNAQPGYSSVILNRLERSHLFISALDEKREWFRYHQLFLDFLRHIHAEINPDEIPILQKRAAEWFEKNDNLDEAFRYAFASGDLDWAVQLLERNIQAMIQSGEIIPLTHWISKLPTATIRERPLLTLGYTWGAIATYQLDLAQDLIDDIQIVLKSAKANRFAEADDSVLGGLAICQSTIALVNGDIEKATEFSNQANQYLKGKNPLVRSLASLDKSLYYVFSGDTGKAIPALNETIRTSRQTNTLMVFIIASVQLAEMQALQGQLNQAWATAQKARFFAVGPEGEDSLLSNLVDICAGTILLEKYQIEEANAYLERGCKRKQSLWNLSSLDGLVSLAQLRQCQSKISEATHLIDEGSQLALSTESSQWDDIIVSGLAVRLALQRGDLADAGHWWGKSGFQDITCEIALDQYPYHIFEYLKLIQARFLIVRGQDFNRPEDLHLALEFLESLIPGVEKFKRVSSYIEILILQAEAHFALGDPDPETFLLKALALGEPEGFRRLFISEGHRITPLMQQCKTVQLNSAAILPSLTFIESLLEKIQQLHNYEASAPVLSNVPSTPASKAEPEINLSRREIEVLRLIAQGKSNKEISSELYLALNTVKRHAYNIYNKLDVNRRTQAVSKARRLGLIP
ncbi:MAG: hypothetical protein H0S79_13955 [Anaerolineaceae bacterium]|nr:hypothetical protein [Anaerolineaceae bacterium]